MGKVRFAKSSLIDILQLAKQLLRSQSIVGLECFVGEMSLHEVDRFQTAHNTNNSRWSTLFHAKAKIRDCKRFAGGDEACSPAPLLGSSGYVENIVIGGRRRSKIL